MSNKLCVPNEIALGQKEYSWRRDWQVNGWLFLAAIISSLADVMFPHVVREWALGWRVVIVLAQFLAISLWVRSLVRWIRGMDELHRRITVSAVIFALSVTLGFMMLWHRLDAAGLFRAIFSEHGDWDILTVGHGFLLMTFCYFWSHSIFNRRYQ